MKKFLLASIRWYQHYLSFDSGLVSHLFPGMKVCRFTPHCSQYTYEAIDSYGIMTGLSLGMKRIMRCHPFNPGGYDPVPVIKQTQNPE
jgi:putative membrane protein insertion efficiency factor